MLLIELVVWRVISCVIYKFNISFLLGRRFHVEGLPNIGRLLNNELHGSYFELKI